MRTVYVIGELSAYSPTKFAIPSPPSAQHDELQRNIDNPRSSIARLKKIAVRESGSPQRNRQGFDFARDPGRRMAYSTCEVAREVEEQLNRKAGGALG